MSILWRGRLGDNLNQSTVDMIYSPQSHTPLPPECNVGFSFSPVPVFLSRFCVLVSTLHKGEGEAWRHLGGLGRINHVYRIRGQGFGKKCWRWRLQSFNHKATSWRLLLCCLSACGATLAEIFIFFLESVPYVYVQRSSDLRSLLNGWRVPELRQCKTAFKAMSVSPVLPSSGETCAKGPSFEDCCTSWIWVE